MSTKSVLRDSSEFELMNTNYLKKVAATWSGFKFYFYCQTCQRINIETLMSYKEGLATFQLLEAVKDLEKAASKIQNLETSEKRLCVEAQSF